MKTATLLVNFGGPYTYEDVKPFLYRLFSDPVIFNFPNAKYYRKPLAWFISNMRDFKARLMYKSVNGTTPLIPITFRQGEKLQEQLNKTNKNIDVFVAFRYCSPDIPEALDQLVGLGYERVVVLPLFPQYSYTTTGSVQLEINNWQEKAENKNLKIDFINNWHDEPSYIESYVQMIERSLKRMDKDSTTLLFSAHSIPYFNIENGDPYEEEIKETCELIIKRLGWNGAWKLAYQSKVGPVKWLEPSTDEVIKELKTDVLTIPISFTCEHVETIYEIGVLYKDIAKSVGIKNFRRVPALNTNQHLIRALYNKIVSCLKDNQAENNSLHKTAV